jgi:hypothetical protein
VLDAGRPTLGLYEAGPLPRGARGGHAGIARQDDDQHGAVGPDALDLLAHAPGCDQCATFHGDYINVGYGSDGHANATWTDMREFRPADGGFAQGIHFARK